MKFPMIVTFITFGLLSGGFLQRQKQIVIYYVKKLSNDISNENKHTMFPENWHFLIHVLSLRHKKTVFVFITEIL